MPHVVIEYSREIESKVEVRNIMEVAFKSASATGVIKPEDLKVRAVPYDYYRLDPDQGTFIHLTLSLLQGRSDAQKEGIAIEMREKLAELLPFVTSISIDIRDMNPVAYKKRILN